jgi:NAD(P)-dependent dehydrogenase (short-subunit alcohol dehydrogenase family)
MSRTILITGASRGIGLALTEAALTAGHTVVAAARDPHGAALRALAGRYDKRLHLVPLDVRSDTSLCEAVGEVTGRVDRIDVLVNNAGVGGGGAPFGELQRAQMAAVLDVNALSPLLVTQAFLPMLQRGTRPLVANISSILGSLAHCSSKSSWFSYEYNASKAALNMVSRMLAWECKPLGIGVLTLHPGWVATDMGGPEAPLDAATSAHGLLQQIDGFDLTRTGAYLDYTGATLPW